MPNRSMVFRFLPRIVALGATTFALLSTVGCSGGAATADPDSGAASSQELVVVQGDFRQSLILTGELRAASGEPVAVPRLPEWETTIRWIVEDGAAVREGDRLVELDTAQIAGQLEDKRTARQQALDQLAQKEAEVDGELERRRLAAERARILLRKAEIAADVPADLQSRKSFEESRLALHEAQVAHDKAASELEGYRESSREELEVLRIDLQKAEREVQEAQRAIDTMVLRAPRGGIVVVTENRREDRKWQVGDTAWVGAQLLEIPDLSAMQVEARLSDVDDGKVAPGMPVLCTLDAYPEDRVPGSVRAISPVAHEAGRQSMQRHFQVLVDLERSDPEVMRPGMSVKVEVLTARRQDATLIPREALSFHDDGRVEAALASGDVVEVTLGPCGALRCVLDEGPPPGTRLGRAS